MIIILTGSVCSGKTTIAKKLAKEKKYNYLNLTDFIKENKLYDSYDKKDKSYVVDTKKLNKALIKVIKNNLIIDGHLSHYLPSKYVDLCIVTKCNLKVLKNRLNKRKYSKQKIEDNLEAEILDTCLNEAKENKHKIKVIYTSKKH
ncbi:adenylate kinase family protein [archaeon]|nr:adenylate kinase family protein [archaeon]